MDDYDTKKRNILTYLTFTETIDDMTSWLISLRARISWFTDTSLHNRNRQSQIDKRWRKYNSWLVLFITSQIFNSFEDKTNIFCLELVNPIKCHRWWKSCLKSLVSWSRDLTLCQAIITVDVDESWKLLSRPSPDEDWHRDDTSDDSLQELLMSDRPLLHVARALFDDDCQNDTCQSEVSKNHASTSLHTCIHFSNMNLSETGVIVADMVGVKRPLILNVISIHDLILDRLSACIVVSKSLTQTDHLSHFVSQNIRTTDEMNESHTLSIRRETLARMICQCWNLYAVINGLNGDSLIITARRRTRTRTASILSDYDTHVRSSSSSVVVDLEFKLHDSDFCKDTHSYEQQFLKILRTWYAVDSGHISMTSMTSDGWNTYTLLSLVIVSSYDYQQNHRQFDLQSVESEQWVHPSSLWISN